ncbi:hypothetical protein Tco_0163234 [Tanacetum coccineum]
MNKFVLASFSSFIVNIESVILTKVKCLSNLLFKINSSLTLLKNLLKFLIYLVKVHVSLPTDGDLMSWHMVSLRMVHIKPTFLPLRTSFRLFELIEMVKSVTSVMRKKLILEYQVLTREIELTLKPLEEIIWENVFCMGVNQDHVPACLCYMLYCVVHSERFNLFYFMAKRMEENPEFKNESYVLYDRIMTPLAAQLERKPRRDHGTRRGRHSTSSSSAFDQPSLSHLNDDDDDGNDEGTLCILHGPYQTNPPFIKDIISSIRIDREGQVRRIRHEEEIDVHDYQILTREIIPTLKPLEEIIPEYIFCLGGNRDHVPACLCFMLYCVVHSERFNLAYYMAKRMEWVTKQARLILPYGMLLTRLFTFIMNEYPELNNESYVLYDRVMTPLAAQLEQKLRRDRGMRRGHHSTSSSSAFDQPFLISS